MEAVTLLKVTGAALAVIVAAGLVALYVLSAPWRLAYRIAYPKRHDRRTTLALAEATVALGVSLLGARRAYRERPMSEDDDYLRGVERGIAAARRSAGYEDGRLSESTRLLERPMP